MVPGRIFFWNRLTYDKAHTTMLNVDSILNKLRNHDRWTHKSFNMTFIIPARRWHST